MIQDFRGTEISVGNTVVYPVRRGSAMQMIEGQVTAIANDDTYGNTNLKVRRQKASSTHADDDNFWTRNIPAAEQRIVTVAPSRVTVVAAAA